VNLILFGQDDAWVSQVRAIKDKLANKDELLMKIAREVILPELRRNYFNSGLHVVTGRLLAAVSEEGAQGNYIEVSGDSVEVGIRLDAEPYFRTIIEGHGGYMTLVKRERIWKKQVKMAFIKPYEGKGAQIYQISSVAVNQAVDIIKDWIAN
jgi:hypothetical protein